MLKTNYLIYMFFNSHETAKELIIYSYNKHINGFVALLEEKEASEIASEHQRNSITISNKHHLKEERNPVTKISSYKKRQQSII